MVIIVNVIIIIIVVICVVVIGLVVNLIVEHSYSRNDGFIVTFGGSYVGVFRGTRTILQVAFDKFLIYVDVFAFFRPTHFDENDKYDEHEQKYHHDENY